MLVGSSDDSADERRLAQGINSAHLKYQNPICERCNTYVTQESDLAYDRFVVRVEREGATRESAYKVFSDSPFCKGSSLYIPLFRYFAKLLGCHLSDINAPIPIHLSRFVAKMTSKNCIWLDIREDPTYRSLSERLSDEKLRYAAHGGLVVITRMPKLLPSRLYSTMTIGSLQFLFYFNLTMFEIWEMQLRFPEFIKTCAETARATIEEPIRQPTLELLGLIRRDNE